MWTVLFALGLAAIFSLPVGLVGWLRDRREEIARRQMALTEALHREFGLLVSPEVRKPLWGPWQIRIGVPFADAAAVGTVFSVAHRVLAYAGRTHAGRHQIVLMPREEPAHGP